MVSAVFLQFAADQQEPQHAAHPEERPAQLRRRSAAPRRRPAHRLVSAQLCCVVFVLYVLFKGDLCSLGLRILTDSVIDL